MVGNRCWIGGPINVSEELKMQIPKTTLLILGGGVAAYFLWKQLEKQRELARIRTAYERGEIPGAKKEKVAGKWRISGILPWTDKAFDITLGQPYGPMLQPESLVRAMPPLKRSVPTAFAVTSVSRAAFSYPFQKKTRPLQRILEQVGAA